MASNPVRLIKIEPGAALMQHFGRVGFVNFDGSDRADSLSGCTGYRVEHHGRHVANIAMRVLDDGAIEVTALQAVTYAPAQLKAAWPDFVRLIRAPRLVAVASSAAMERILASLGFVAAERDSAGHPVMSRAL